MEWIADEYLDCKGLRCPVPIVKISRRMKTLSVGSILCIEATDAAFRADLGAWIKAKGAELLRFEEIEVGQRALVRKLVAEEAQ